MFTGENNHTNGHSKGNNSPARDAFVNITWSQLYSLTDSIAYFTYNDHVTPSYVPAQFGLDPYI